MGAQLTSESPPPRHLYLASGRRYMWRGGGEDDDARAEPEVRLWEQSSLDSGKPFWYTAEGKVSLTDPFDLESGYTEI